MKHKSVQEWGQDAYDYVQYACNLSGIVFAFDECIQDLDAEAQRLKQSESWVDAHPVSVVWADKLDDLSGSRRLPVIPCGEHLTALLPRFAARMRELCDDSHHQDFGTDWRNRHPDAQSFVRRIVHVTRSRERDRLFQALTRCKQIAQEKHTEPDRSHVSDVLFCALDRLVNSPDLNLDSLEPETQDALQQAIKALALFEATRQTQNQE